MAPVRAVIFDLDDTLLDHQGSTRAALASWLPRLGAEADTRLVEAWFDSEHRHFESWRSGQITFEEQRRRRLRDLLPLIGSDVPSEPDLDLLFAGFLAEYEAAWQAFDDVLPVITFLTANGFDLAVLTNGTAAQQNAKVTRIGIRDRLTAVFTSEELGVAKPHPDIYRQACRELGVSPDKTLHVGDNYQLDVVAAQEAGLQALHLDRHHKQLAPRELRMVTLAELPDRLAQPSSGHTV